MLYKDDDKDFKKYVDDLTIKRDLAGMETSGKKTKCLANCSSQNKPKKDQNFKCNKKRFSEAKSIPIEDWSKLSDDNNTLWIKIWHTFMDQDSDEKIQKVKDNFIKKYKILLNWILSLEIRQ